MFPKHGRAATKQGAGPAKARSDQPRAGRLSVRSGNRLWQRLAVGDQARLTISGPADARERDAERAADKVMASPSIDPYASSAGAGKESNTPSAGGAPLPHAMRSFFGERFGDDFSGVRLHTDADAADAAQSVDARAFTVGTDIVFNRGEYSPESGEGRLLLAHELAHVAQHPPSSIVHRQPITKTPVDVDTTAGEVEDLVDKNQDHKGALEKLDPLDMRDLLAVVAKLQDDASAKGSAAYGDLLRLLETAPNKPTEKVKVPRLLAAFDAAPTRKLRNPEPGVAGTSPTVSGYRKRPDTSTTIARPGDWGEDPADNTWISHPDGIRTYWGTTVAKDRRSSAWLADNPGNADYKKSITKRAIGSFRWGRGVHDFAIYFSETDAAADLRERVATFSKSTMIDYLKTHDATDPNRYLQNMQKAVPELNGSDPTTLWTGDDAQWARLMEGFKSAEGWVVGTTVTKADVSTISTDPKDAALVAYYKTLVGAP